MKNIIFNFINALILIISVAPVFAQNASGSIEGNWLGTLDVSGIKMRLVLKVAKADNGYTAKLDSVDQGAKDLPIDSITLSGDKVIFSAARFGMSYEGTLNEKADEISGTFRQGAGSTPFVFRRVTEIVKNTRPQDPPKPYPYAEEEVVYRNAKDNVKLAGTLTFPRGAGKFPAVILITGSGTQDRNETVAGHRPFLVLADYLTRKGIAVLRVDDRGAGGSDLGSLSATTENFVGDVLAGVEYLKKRAEINPKQIGLIGHSEGGMIAPLAAIRSSDIALIVMLAGAGQSGKDLILTQTALMQRKSGADPETSAKQIDLQKSLLEIIMSEPDDKLAENKINQMLEARKSKMNEQQLKEFAPVQADIKADLPLLFSPWYRYFLSLNPSPVLEKVRVPVLALNGENDVQVSAKENLALISVALKVGKNKDFTVKSFPQLNHLFQTSRTGLTNEYGTIEETIAPVILETVSNWILERTIKTDGNFQPPQAPHGWHKFEAESHFTFYLPPGMKLSSAVRCVECEWGSAFSNSRIKLYAEYTSWNEEYAARYLAERKEYVKDVMEIDGREAKIQSWRSGNEQKGYNYLAEVRFYTEAGKLIARMSALCKGQREVEIAKRIFRSVDFP